MTYELCKQLKDAGFPFVKATSKYADAAWTDSMFTDDAMTIYIKPTLSELIEACGKDFLGVVRNVLLNIELPGKKWIARGNELSVDGDSSEEAVANLWLQLNSQTK